MTVALLRPHLDLIATGFDGAQLGADSERIRGRELYRTISSLLTEFPDLYPRITLGTADHRARLEAVIDHARANLKGDRRATSGSRNDPAADN